MRDKLRHAFVAALVVFALLSAGVATAVRYQPLEQVGDLTTSSEAAAIVVEEFEDVGAHILRYDHGTYVAYALTVRNTGRVGVTVTTLDLPDEQERRLLQPVQALVDTSAGGPPEDPATLDPLQPFALHPGEERTVVVQARFDNCEYYTERAIERIAAQRITFRVAGISRTAVLPLRRPLLVRSPTIRDCPERTLNRSEHRRTDP